MGERDLEVGPRRVLCVACCVWAGVLVCEWTGTRSVHLDGAGLKKPTVKSAILDCVQQWLCLGWQEAAA